MKKVRSDICMMFSGGLDTTAAAAQLLEENRFERLHLLTFCNGVCVGAARSGVHVEELREMYGAHRLIHEIIDMTDVFAEIRAPLLDLLLEYRSGLVFDLCCRLAMETSAIIYARNHGLTHICDGTNLAQGRLFMERPEYMEKAREFFTVHGLTFFSPVYEKAGERAQRREELAGQGFSTGPRFLEKLNIGTSIMHQPFCFYAFHTFFFTSFLARTPGLGPLIEKMNLSLEDALRLRRDREAIARRIIEERTTP